MSGNTRYRFPVSLARALTPAGEIAGTGGSPHPVGASSLGTMCTSMATGALGEAFLESYTRPIFVADDPDPEGLRRNRR